MNSRRFWVGLLCVVGLGGCAVGPDYQPPELEVPQVWGQASSAGPTTEPVGPTTQPVELAAWWKAFNDPVLDSLIERAVESNHDLRVATARVREARAQRGVVSATLWPQVNASASHAYRGSSLNTAPKTTGELSLGKRLRNAAIKSALGALTNGQGGATGGTTGGTESDAGGGAMGIVSQAVSAAVSNKLQGSEITASRDQNLFQMGLDASWEIDVFGGTRRALEAADADTAASEESRRDVLVTLLSEVALNYVRLRGAQRRLAIARANIQAQANTVELTHAQYKAGFTNKLDTAQAQTQLASTQSQVPVLESTIRQAIHQLSVLVGQPPAFLTPELEKERPIPIVPPATPVGLPSELLRRRPDVRMAERRLAAATARIGEAVADLFPRFSLTGSFGPQSRNVRHLFDRNSLAWSVGPQVSWPIFDGWRIRSNIQAQDAIQEQALATYEKTVLVAFQDVENALVAYSNEQIRRQSLAIAVESGRQSTELSNELYTRGLTAFLNVLESQRALYTLQDALAQSETAEVTNLIALYKALGGGWDPLTE